MVAFSLPRGTGTKADRKQGEGRVGNMGQDGRGALKGLKSVPSFQNNGNDKHVPGLFSHCIKQGCWAGHQIVCQDKLGLVGSGV